MMARKRFGMISGHIHLLAVVLILAILAFIVAAYYFGRSQVFESVSRQNPPAATVNAPPNVDKLNAALLEAARSGQQHGDVTELVKAGVDINYRDASGKTALHYAAASGHQETTADLLRLGADPTFRDQAGKTALDYAVAGSHDGTAREITNALAAVPAARMAASSNDDKLNAALLEAARTGQQEGNVTRLVKTGADVNYRDASGKTALHYAAAGDHNGTTADLLHLGASPNIRDLKGKTALHYAASGGYVATATELLHFGADPSIRDNSGKTALDYARQGGHESTAGAIIKALAATPATRGITVGLQGSQHYSAQIPVLKLFLILFVLGVLFLIPILLLGLLIRLLRRRRTELSLGHDETEQLQQLGLMAQKMDERMANLETILLDRERTNPGKLGAESER